MKHTTSVNINDTMELSVPMHEVHSINKTPRGEFPILDIINYIRLFLTDDELLHFNRLSTAYAGEYDKDMEWQEHAITMSDLSITRQLAIYERIETKHANTRDLFMSSKFYYYYIAEHFFSDLGYYTYSEPLPSITFKPYVLKDKNNTPFSKEELKKIQKKADELSTQISIPYSETMIFKYLPFRLLLILKSATVFFYYLFLIFGPPLIFYFMYQSTHVNFQNAQCHELSNQSDIKIMQIDLWTDTNITHMISCNTALTNTTIASHKNFSQLMSMLDFYFNVTNLTLATCLTLFGVCRNQDGFSDHLMTVNSQITVGCHYAADKCNEINNKSDFLLYFGTILLMPMASCAFYLIANYCFTEPLFRATMGFFQLVEKLLEAQDSKTIVQRTSQDHHPSLTADLSRSQLFFKTIRDKTHVELQAIASNDERSQDLFEQLL